MNASQNTFKAAAGRWAVVVALALGALIVTTGCDTTGALGLPEYSPAYWGDLGIGTQNVWSWGGLADPWNTSSLGLPLSPWVYWSNY